MNLLSETVLNVNSGEISEKDEERAALLSSPSQFILTEKYSVQFFFVILRACCEECTVGKRWV